MATKNKSNKKTGNDFEAEFCKMLSGEGFWVHNFAQKVEGQPGDVIAVKDTHAFLIDCKVCGGKGGFALSRVEENQDLSMTLWEQCGNGTGWFALHTKGEVYMVSHGVIQGYRDTAAKMSAEVIRALGLPFGKWVTVCV